MHDQGKKHQDNVRLYLINIRKNKEKGDAERDGLAKQLEKIRKVGVVLVDQWNEE